MVNMNSEEMLKAAHIMMSAASAMGTAAHNLAASLEANQRFMDDWLTRYRAPIVEDRASEPPEPAWIDWPGGFQPSQTAGQVVWVKLRDGTALLDRADEMRWRHFKGTTKAYRDKEVVAWRLP